MAIDTIEELATYRFNLLEDTRSIYQGRPTRRFNLNRFSLYTKDAIDYRFIIADLALKKNCVNIADKNYRHIVSRYSGEAYRSHRERARIGIDDVREKRNRK